MIPLPKVRLESGRVRPVLKVSVPPLTSTGPSAEKTVPAWNSIDTPPGTTSVCARS